MRIVVNNPEAVVKETFWLAYQAAGGPAGLGWANVRSAGDYPGGPALAGADKPGEAYGDYVFGRMLKLGIRWDGQSVTIRDSEPRRDYQAWCGTYPTYLALVEAAAGVQAG